MERTIVLCCVLSHVLLLLLRLLFLICRFALSLFADSKYELASVQNGGFLKIHQVDSSQDAGTYACIVLNRAGEEGRREMELSVNSMWHKQCEFRTSIIWFSILSFHICSALFHICANAVAVLCKGPPIIEPFAFPKNLQEGGRAQVTCAVSSGDMPVTFSWKKDDKPIPLGLQVSSSQPFSQTIAWTKTNEQIRIDFVNQKLIEWISLYLSVCCSNG